MPQRYGPPGIRGHRITGRTPQSAAPLSSRDEDQAAPAARPPPAQRDLAQAAAIGDDRFSEASGAARLDARSHPLIAEGGPQIFGDPDARFTDLVTLIIATAGSLRA
jgi:hypothetical protein